MTKTKIEWSDHSWNPITGCTKVSLGCKNCYAERMARRLAGRYGYPKDGLCCPACGRLCEGTALQIDGVICCPHCKIELVRSSSFDVTLHHNRLEQPLKWRKPRRVFVASMGDLFHEDVPDEFIIEVWSIMLAARHHTFQVLTKRPARAAKLLNQVRFPYYVCGVGHFGWPLSNIQLGVSIENQDQMWRVEYLRETPATTRFLSLEPLLGAIDLRGELLDGDIHWVIVGGESGPNARPMHPNWARSVRDQCQAAGVPYFHKQNGEWLPGCKELLEEGYGKVWTVCPQNQNDKQPQIMWHVGKKAAGRLLDGVLHEEYPR